MEIPLSKTLYIAHTSYPKSYEIKDYLIFCSLLSRVSRALRMLDCNASRFRILGIYAYLDIHH